VLLAGGSFETSAAPAAVPPGTFTPGEVWLDTEGNPIDAHGGGVLRDGGVYYWYGEDRGQAPRGAVACYSSTNLFDWKRLGGVLLPDSLPRINDRRTFVERPKVIFNPSTKKFVMWMHLEQGGYRFSRAGIALSDSPAGPFTFLEALRPIANTNAFTSLDPDSARQKEYGATFRDMNLFADDDGRAYVFYSAEDNWTMYVVRLNAAFTGPELPAVENKTWARILVRQITCSQVQKASAQSYSPSAQSAEPGQVPQGASSQRQEGRSGGCGSALKAAPALWRAVTALGA
jgi:hypothetical protein